MSPIPFYVFAVFAIFLQIIVLVYNAILYTRIHYAVTNKRVIIQGGIIGRDFDAVDFDKIVQVQVKVGLIDIISGLFGKKTGSIFVHTPIASTMLTASQGLIPTFHILAHVADPYSVFRFVKKVSYDVKTDIEYPNALRPKKNPGYMTEYNPSAEEFS